MAKNRERLRTESRYILDPTTREDAIQTYFRLAADTTTNAVLRGRILIDFRRAGDSRSKLEDEFKTPIGTLNKFMFLAEKISDKDLKNLAWTGHWTVDYHLITRTFYADIRAEPGLITVSPHLTEKMIDAFPRLLRAHRRQPTKELIEERLGKHVSLNRVHCCDCKDGIKLLPDMSIGTVITSPMYADMPGGLPSSVWPRWFVGVMKSLHPKMSADGNVIVNVNSHMDDGEWNLYVMRTVLDICTLGWHLKTPITWHKTDVGHQGSNNEPKLVTEYIWRFSKSRHGAYIDLKACGHLSKRIGFVENIGGSRRFRGTGIARGEGRTKVTNLISVGVSKNPKLDIDNPPPQYPPELVRQIILTYAKPGGIVLDPFAGSGTTCLVAQSLGYDFIGFEIEPRYAEYANYRLMTDKRFARPT